MLVIVTHFFLGRLQFCVTVIHVVFGELSCKKLFFTF